METKRKLIYGGLGSGLLAGFFASFCCTGPALLAFLGLSGLALTKPLNAFIGLVLALLGAALWRHTQSGAMNCCRSKESSSFRFFSTAMLVTLIVGYFAMTVVHEPNSGQSQPNVEAQISTPDPRTATFVRCASCEK